jgi:L,D-transpeptidase ErfK/SrfK
MWGRQVAAVVLAVGLATLGQQALAQTDPDVYCSLLPGRLTGSLNPYKVRRGDTITSISTRFTVHPIRVYKPNQEALRDGLEYRELIYVDQRRITPRFRPVVSGIVLNIPEAQVYLVDHGRLVTEYPVAVSTTDRKAPLGRTQVVSKQKNPTWHVPKSIQDEMAEKGLEVKTEVPPGPENPLGNRWIGFADGTFGFHGTLVPSSIKRYASHGCVRFLRPHIEDLYDRVHVGTPVRVLYQPVLLAAEGKAIWLSVYPDIYELDYDFKGAVKALAQQAGVESRLDWNAVEHAIHVADGIVTNVAISPHPTPKPTPKPTPRPSVAAPSPTPVPPTPAPSVEPSVTPSVEPAASPSM